MLDWKKLLNEERRKNKEGKKIEDTGTKGSRTEMERDYDRILFATPTRRLADKTQVFPMDSSDSVRTRLTHSMEVSNLARSIGTTLAFDYAEEIFGKKHEELNVKRKVPALLAAMGLVHDLGNPPFGHQGEVAMRDWFKAKRDNENSDVANMHVDFIKFDGNPQTFRLLTKLQILNDDFGLNLTFGTLSAIVKYPSMWDSESNGGYDKFGVFESESDVLKEVWAETGLSEGVRHPLTHIMEACDDIAYAVIDAEDTVKKGYASFYDLMEHLKHFKDDPIVKQVIDKAEKKNKKYKEDESLSSSELNEISMQMFRVYAIYHLIDEVTKVFIGKCHSIINLDISDSFELLKESKGNILCKALKKFDLKYAFRNKSVLKLELVGNNYIMSTMDMLWEAISQPNGPFARYACHLISENYRRARKSSKQSDEYKDCQLLCDSISGMTDNYLVGFHNELRPLFDGLPKV
jgi:dGTPase